MMVLWLLILRGIAIEFRNHIDNPLWKPAWDTVFGAASAILAFVFGVALGNVVRGVPLDANGYFFALFTRICTCPCPDGRRGGSWSDGSDAPGGGDWVTSEGR
jgi:cytochrome bd-type quinol oxidase subunit 2